MKLESLIVPIMIVLGLFIVIQVDRCQNTPEHNLAVDFVHMVAPEATCSGVESSPYFPTSSAVCKTGNIVLFCTAGQFTPPSCIKVADLTPPAPTPSK